MTDVPRIVVCWLVFAAGVVAAPPITAAAFTPGGKQVLLGSQDGVEIRSWPELKSVERIRTKLSHVHDLVFSPDGKTLLVVGGSPAESGVVEAIEWPTRKQRHRIELGQDLAYKVAWSPDGTSWTAACADGICRVVSTDTGREEVQYKGHSRAVLAVVYLPDGKTIVSAGVDQTLQVWDAKTGKLIRTLDNHTATVNDLAARPGEKADTPPTAASVSDDRTVRLWNPTTGRLLRLVRLDFKPSAVAWSPDGSRLLVGSVDGTIRRLDPDTLEQSSDKPTLGGRLHTLIPHADGKTVLVAGEGGKVLKVE